MIPARLIGATGIFLKNTLLVLFRTIIILAAANVLIAIFLDESGGNSPDVAPKPEDKSQFPTEQLIAKYGAFLAEAFPGKTEDDVRRFFSQATDRFSLPMAYEPFVEFRSSWRESRYVNIDVAGFRSVGPDQGPWPADRNSLNVFVYGSSMAFGPVGGRDDETIAAILQSALREKSGKQIINVYSFASSGHFSSQETTFFQNHLRSGDLPDIVVFLDGGNEFAFWDGETAQSQFYRNANKSLYELLHQLGRDKGFLWHAYELLRTLPMVKFAKRLLAKVETMLTSDGHPAGLFGPTVAHALALADPLAKAVPRKGSAPTDGDGSEARRIRWIETGPRRDPSLPWNADFNTKILWVDEPDISSEEIYAREYTDGRRISDPIKLAEALSRYLMNKTIAGSAALALQIEPVFAWLPHPLYKYDLNLHPFHIQDEQRRSKYGYEMLARHIQSHDMEPGFVWCADIQQGVRQPLYGDQVHYSVRGSHLIAGCVADAIFRRGIFDRAWQKKFESNTAAAIRSAYSIDAGGRIADTVKRRIGFLFDAGAVVNLQMSHPLEDWREMSSDGIVLTDNSSGIADISQEFPIEDDPAGVYETSIRVRPDTSDFAALVVSFFGGPKPQHDVIVFNPISGSVISASPGDYRIVREANGWSKITLVSSAAPGSNAIRVTLYPRHGSPEKRGAIRFGGGELNRIDH